MQVVSSLVSALLVFGATVVQAQSNCQVVSFNVSGSALNRNLTASFPANNITSLLTAYYTADLIPVSGSQTLVGTYCKATATNSNNAKLQVLFHSISADRFSWSGLGGVGSNYPAVNPDQYSWIQYANAQGYPTLAIDRLGNGKSSHPDPILVVQSPYEQSLYINLAKQIRAGAPQLGTAYNFLIYVGNSYGSQLGTGIAGEDRTAYDEYVLTGDSATVDKGLVGVALALAEPAAIVDPARFGTLPVGYLTTASEIGRTNSFFGSHAQVLFDPAVGHLFFTRKDVVSVGQFVSVYAFPFAAPGFTGRVLLLDGENDQPFCGPGSPVLGPAYCGKQPQQTGILFPNAQYNYKTVNQIGHAVQLHTRSQTLFRIAHQFLAGQNFAGGPPA